MNTLAIEHMPATSRLWVYQADRPFLQEEKLQIDILTQNFLSQWAAHGAELKASHMIEYDQFIVIAVDESFHAASGCSIDSSVNFVRSIEQKFGLSLLDRTKVAVLDDDKIEIHPFNAIKQQISTGNISPTATVFNNAVQNVGEWKSSWRQEARLSWMGRFFN
ncbi:MAG: hypothetical protein JXR03_01290 [Cyclobacteriaceae bacterium]